MRVENTFSKYLINKLTDWLTVVLAVSLILWLGFTLPVFSANKQSINALTNVSEDRLKSTVSTLIDTYNPRIFQYDTLDFATTYLRTELSELGNVYTQPFDVKGNEGKSYENLILSLGPETEEIIVIGAHYDAEDGSLDTEGNASGVAAFLELARHLSENENKLHIKVQLVAYPISMVETKSLFSVVKTTGSDFHAKSLKKAGTKVKMMLSLDSVGRYSNERGSQKYPHQFMHAFYPNQGDYISVVGLMSEYQSLLKVKKSFVGASSLPMVSFNLPDNFVPTTSMDHLNYQKLGYPSMLITDTAKYRELDSTKGSVIEQLDYTKMAELVTGLYQVVMDNESQQSDVVMAYIE